MTGILETVLLALGGSVGPSIVVKATIILMMALLATSLARRCRAAVRHVMITASFAVLLLLPVASLVGPAVSLEVAVESNAPAQPTPLAALDVARAAEPRDAATRGSGDSVSAASSAGSGISFTTLIEPVWVAGTVLWLAPIAAGLWQMRWLRLVGERWPDGEELARQLAREAGVVRDIDVRVGASLPGPVTYGMWRPVIILPADAPEWAGEDVERALVHELEHVRRGDWWTQTAARGICALYWFHPLVWMARRRMVLEAELACDDAVLSRFESTSYAEQLVKLAQRLSTRQPMPAMANRRDLRTRIGAVLDAAQARGRARAASTMLTLVAAAALAVGLAPLRTVARAYAVNEITRDVVLEPSRPVAAADPTERRTIVDAPVVRPVAGSARDQIVRAQGQAGAVDRPRYAEATITPCGDANGGRNGGPGSLGTPSAGVLGMGCRSVADMIRRSHGYGEHSGVPVEGGPSWIESEHYQITARAEGNPGMSVMMGPMLQTLLEDRFRLRLSRDTRNVSGYALAVADGGHKLTEASCDPPRQPPVAFLPPPDRPCAWSLVITVRGSNGSVGGKWVTSGEFAGALRDLLGRPVVDRTQIPWRFDARIEFAPEGTMVQAAIGDTRFVKNPNPGGATAPVIFSAIEGELGLRLEPATVPTDVFVVEHVERP